MNKLGFLILLIVIASVKAANNCPNGGIPSFTNTSICYSFVADPLVFLEAEMNCQSSNGHLASITDGFTNALLAQHAKIALINATVFWVGGQDLGTKDQWTWMDNAPFTYTNWAPEEPVELPDFDCLGQTVTTGYWYTYNCFKPKPYVCEIPPSAPLPTAGTPQTRPTTTTQNVITFTTTTTPPTIPTTTPFVVISTTQSLEASTTFIAANDEITTSQGGCPAETVYTGPCIGNMCPFENLCIDGRCCAVSVLNFLP
jgi:hypothetical protein